MIGISYLGKEYRSVKEACKALHVSYQRVRRLIRHFARAHKDPTVALDWATGRVLFRSYAEPKTDAFFRDGALAADRGEKYRARHSAVKKLYDI